MRVRVLKAKFFDYWYSHYIGHIFEVEENDATHWVLKDSFAISSGPLYIAKEDSIIVPTELKFILESILIKLKKEIELSSTSSCKKVKKFKS